MISSFAALFNKIKLDQDGNLHRLVLDMGLGGKFSDYAV